VLTSGDVTTALGFTPRNAATAISLTADVSGILPIANGGTALSALGSALQVLRVNAGATALEYAAASGGVALGDSPTWTGPHIWSPSSAASVPITITGGTVTTAVSPLAITQTFNAAGVTFPGITYTVTNTASAINSTLLNLLVGSASKLRVMTGGTGSLGPAVVVAAGVLNSPGLAFDGAAGGAGTAFGAHGFYGTANGTIYGGSSAAYLGFTASGLTLKDSVKILWSAASADVNGWDTGIGRNAAGVVEINNQTAGTLGKLLAGRVVTAKTSNYTVLTADKSTFFTNTGASGTINFTLPTAVAGLTYEFYRDAAFSVTITAGASTTIRIGASVSAAAGNASLDAVGSKIVLVAISATQWVGESVGTITLT